MRKLTVLWPYPEVPDLDAPVRFGRRVIGRVSAVHVNSDGTVSLDIEVDSPLVDPDLGGLSAAPRPPFV